MDRILELQKRLDETAASNEQFKEEAFALQQEVRDLKDVKASLIEGLDDLLEQCEHLGTMCNDADAMKEKVSRSLTCSWASALCCPCSDV